MNVTRKKLRTEPGLDNVQQEQWVKEGIEFRHSEKMARRFVTLLASDLAGDCIFARAEVFSNISSIFPFVMVCLFISFCWFSVCDQFMRLFILHATNAFVKLLA
jgi:hypothetical protein